MNRPTWWMVAVIVVAAGCGSSSSSTPSTPTTPTTPGTPGTSICGTAGVSCFGTSNYIEYIPGDLPVVVSVPHGGALTPANIPDRTVGTTATDLNTIPLGQAVSAAFTAATGRAPHVVIVHLRRTKLDANREVVEAAQGNADAARAWNEYHAFIELAMSTVRQRYGTGFYMDLHGHGHAVPRLELGYMVTASTLNQSNAQLDAANVVMNSSLRLLAQGSALSSSALLRGPTSLGGLLESRVRVVPSPSDPSPGADEYFNGGYSTDRHTSTLPGVQIECHYTGVRDTATARAAFADALVGALRTYLSTHLRLTI